MEQIPLAVPPAQHRRHKRGAKPEKPKNMGAALMRLWKLTAGKRRGLGLVLVCSGLASLSAVFSPYLIGELINRIDRGSPLGMCLLLLTGLYFGDWLVRFLQQSLMAAAGQRMICHIRTSLFSHLRRLPLSYFDTRQHGELMSRLTNDVDNISNTITDSLIHLLLYGFTIFGILWMMLRLSLLLTAVSMVSVGLIYVLTRTVTRHTGKLFQEQQRLLGQMNGQVEESISGIAMVKAFGQEEAVLQQFSQCNEEFCQIATKAQIWSGFLMPLTNVIHNLSYVMLAVVSGVMAAQGQISLGAVLSFLLYSRQFTRPFVDIAGIYNEFQTAVAGAERVFQVFDEAGEPENRPEALPLKKPKGAISFRNVTFGYDPARPVLKHISLDIPAGMRVAVAGPTGSGKTTLINLLTRFYDVGEGEILLDGHDLRAYRMEDLRDAFGVVLQDTALFGISVRDNISYGQGNVALEQIVEAAKIAGAHSFISRLPEGYNTVLTQGGAELSQGQRQLLTIARAVLADAPIMILDEATSSVDTVTEQQIRQAMERITRGRTSILIAHRLSTIRDADRILLLQDGEIKEQGTHDELMAENGIYADLYRTQMGEL